MRYISRAFMCSSSRFAADARTTYCGPPIFSDGFQFSWTQILIHIICDVPPHSNSKKKKCYFIKQLNSPNRACMVDWPPTRLPTNDRRPSSYVVLLPKHD